MLYRPENIGGPWTLGTPSLCSHQVRVSAADAADLKAPGKQQSFNLDFLLKKKGIKNKWECLKFSKSQKGSSSLSGLLLSYRTDVDGHFAVSLPWEAITKPFPSWVRYPLSSRGQASHSVFLEVSMVTILQLPCTLCPQIPQTNGFYMPSFPIMYPITKQTFTFPYL